jgi:tetratricopeptide (TPR) repeat protein
MGKAHSLSNLGAVDGRLGRHDQSIARLQEALTIGRELGSPYGKAEALRHLGDTFRSAGRDGEARAVWREALEICESLHLPEADLVRARLVALETGDRVPSKGA